MQGAARPETTSSPAGRQGFSLPPNAARFGERTILFGHCANDIKVSGRDTDGRLAVFDYAGKVRGGPPVHLHHGQDEIYFVQAGDYLFQVGEQRTRVKAGGLIFLPRSVPHGFAQLSDVGRMLFMFSPAGKMEDYFRALSRLPGPPPADQEALLFADHGMRWVGPPIDPGDVEV